MVIALLFAISASVVPISQSLAAGERLGATCTTEGVFTGTKSTSLVCAKNGNRLAWQRVKLSSGGGSPRAR
jgi:raffinose/stachyose/melibiose transport system substrate-binding protein